MHRIHTVLWQALARIAVTAGAVAWVPLPIGGANRGLYFSHRIAHTATAKHLSEHAPKGHIGREEPLAAAVGTGDFFRFHRFAKQRMQLTRRARPYRIESFFEGPRGLQLG